MKSALRNCRDAGDRRSAWCPDRGVCDHGGRTILRLLLSWFLTWPAWPSSDCPRRPGRCICWPGPAPVRRPARGAVSRRAVLAAVALALGGSDGTRESAAPSGCTPSCATAVTGAACAPCVGSPPGYAAPPPAPEAKWCAPRRRTRGIPTPAKASTSGIVTSGQPSASTTTPGTSPAGRPSRRSPIRKTGW